MNDSYDVVVIDSGYSGKNEIRNLQGINLSGNGDKSDYSDLIGHGSLVLNTILSYSSPQNVLIIKAFDSYDGITVSKLKEILKYILNNISCHVINLSVGVAWVDNHDELKHIIDALYKKNIIIVSAFSNSGEMSFPAAYSQVVGVDCSTHKLPFNSFEYIDDNIINIRCGSDSFRVMNHREEYVLVQGSSFATAYVTALAVNYIANNTSSSKEAFLCYLSQKAVKVYQQFTFNHEPQKLKKEIKKAIVFPFNKEIHALASHEDLLKFEIIGYYDSDISIKNNKKISDVIMASTSTKIINPYKNIKWNDDFDTVICGHCDELINLTHFDYFEDIKKKCKQHNKFLYCFDGKKIAKNNNDEETIYSPLLSFFDTPKNRYGKLYQIGKPVLGILGTSSQQGKYNLQLNLRKMLIDKGYRVAQIASEPSGYLFDMDFVYPFGYESPLSLNWQDTIILLNDQIEKMCEKSCDLIIVGSQSGTIAANSNNTSSFHMHQYSFLLGCMPDNVILCINCYDDIDYIERTISFIQSVIPGKVIALVLFPLGEPNAYDYKGKRKQLSDDEINKCIQNLNKSIKIPVVRNSSVPEDLEKLYSIIIDNYCEE